MFFLNCLFHFSSILLNEKQDQDTNIFLKKYLNWNYLRGYILHRSLPIFYVFKVEKLFGKNNVVELIIKQKYFD